MIEIGYKSMWTSTRRFLFTDDTLFQSLKLCMSDKEMLFNYAFWSEASKHEILTKNTRSSTQLFPDASCAHPTLQVYRVCIDNNLLFGPL